MNLLIIPLALALATLSMPVIGAADWPMLGHDAARSGATPDEIRPPFERKWYRLFADEGIMSGVQPVVADGKVLVGTLRGIVHALDAETGRDLWSFQASGAFLHTCAAAEGKVFFGSADGAVCALSGADGSLVWKVQTGAAVWNAPAIHNGIVFIGSRDENLYAIDAASGQVRWRAATDGPLLNSPAIDAPRGRVYIGSEAMRVHAFDVRDGRPVWRSAKLPGVSLRGYHPVIAPDGSVMVTVAPAISLDTFQAVLLDMVKAVFGDFASWRHKKEENARLREQNFKQMEDPATYPAQLDYLRKRLRDQPAYQTFFVLDPETGRQKFVAPIVYAESMNGPGAPALVSSEDKVIVKFQVLLRSRYEHYSPFLNVGYLDTATGHITPIMEQTRAYGWHDSLLLVHDEQCQLSLAGRVLINTHQDNVNGLELETLKGYSEPFCNNIHEPQKGEAAGIWARVLRGEPLPAGKEWLARGTAIYGGGSVLDVPVTVAGDSFYFLPTHEINAGAAIIAFQSKQGGTAGRKSSPPTARLSDDEWAKVQQMPWDWDTLEMGRLNHVLAALPGKVPGTRQSPLTNDAAAVAAITDAQLDKFIWETRSFARQEDSRDPARQLKARLARAVDELVSSPWRPLLFPSGKHPEEAYRFFDEPTETLYTLALAYPHLDAAAQEKARRFVANFTGPGGPLAGPTGRRVYDAGAGQVRSSYEHPPEKLMRTDEGIVRSGLARLYPLWLWAQVTGDWRKLEKDWPHLRKLIEQPPSKFEEDCRNGHVAGLIAYCRIADHLKDTEARSQSLIVARKAMRDRLAFELSHTRGGLIWSVPKLRSQFSRWHFLTPEVGRLLAEFAKPIHRQLMETYVDYHRPTWWLAWNVETLMRNECPYQFPTVPVQIFAARSLILGEPAEKLAAYLDIPWCRGDEFYIQKLAHALEAKADGRWQELR